MNQKRKGLVLHPRHQVCYYVTPFNVPRTDLAVNNSGPQSKLSKQDAGSCLRGILHQMQVVKLAVVNPLYYYYCIIILNYPLQLA
jgi:hypothetical protein